MFALLYKQATTPAIIGGLMVACAAALFSFKAILVKLVYEFEVDAISILCLRMLFSLPVFLFIAYREQKAVDALPLARKDFFVIMVLGLSGYYLASFLDFVGLQYVSAGLERLILFTNPTITLLLCVVFFSQAFGKREIAALCISYAGIYLAYSHDISSDPNHASWGVLLIFISAICYSCYLAFGAPLIKRLGARRFTALAMCVSCLAVIIHFGSTHVISSLLTLPNIVYAYALVMALFSTIVPAFLLSAGIQRVGAAHAAMVGSIGPIVTLGLAAVILGEQLMPLQQLGAVLIISGVLILQYRRK
ncbi:MAG: DMT family transporter [Mariprofundales bacterium]